MKVVLFCGGLGMRMRADNQSLPKPMMSIGSRPVLWHVMRYYAHFGHTEFILCLGYGAEVVKEYFLNYRETASNDFVITKGGQHIELLETDISDWTITFIDTGLDTAIGERLRRVRPYLEDDEVFLANYGDVLTDAPMNDHGGRVPRDRRSGSVPRGQAPGLLPRGGHRRGRPRDGTDPGGRHVHEDQRGVLRPQAGDLRLPRGGRRPGHGRVRSGGQGRQDPRRPVRRVLGPHGHPQGAQRPRGATSTGGQPLGPLAMPAGATSRAHVGAPPEA